MGTEVMIASQKSDFTEPPSGCTKLFSWKKKLIENIFDIQYRLW